MIVLIKQLLMQFRNLYSGAIVGATSIIPPALLESELFTSTTNIAGLAVPSFILYLVFLSE